MEKVIRGKIDLLSRFFGILRDTGNKKSNRGLGFNKRSYMKLYSPVDNTLIALGKPSKGRSPFTRVMIQGINCTKGEYPPIDPNVVYDWLSAKGNEQEAAIVITDDRIRISYGDISRPGYIGGRPLTQDFDDKSLKESVWLDENVSILIPKVVYEIGLGSFKTGLTRLSKINESYFAFYSIGGDLYMNVMDGSSNRYTHPLSVNDAIVMSKGEEYPDKEPYDFAMPVSRDIPETAESYANKLSVAVPKNWRDYGVVEWSWTTVFSSTESIETSMIVGKNKEYRSMLSLDEFIEKLNNKDL